MSRIFHKLKLYLKHTKCILTSFACAPQKFFRLVYGLKNFTVFYKRAQEANITLLRVIIIPPQVKKVKYFFVNVLSKLPFADKQFLRI